MPIGGALVITVNKQNLQGLAGSLEAEPGVEVNGVGPAGIAITVESASMKEMTRLTAKIRGRMDVADLQVTYCNWEDQD
jgi:nitrate reductase NapAB chaperone NapD